MTQKTEGAVELGAALLVLFTAKLDPKASLVLAMAGPTGMGLFHLLKKR